MIAIGRAPRVEIHIHVVTHATYIRFNPLSCSIQQQPNHDKRLEIVAFRPSTQSPTSGGHVNWGGEGAAIAIIVVVVGVASIVAIVVGVLEV